MISPAKNVVRVGYSCESEQTNGDVFVCSVAANLIHAAWSFLLFESEIMSHPMLTVSLSVQFFHFKTNYRIESDVHNILIQIYNLFPITVVLLWHYYDTVNYDIQFCRVAVHINKSKYTDYL